jgi:RimJ/RimL family protein N-acetyltransferase
MYNTLKIRILTQKDCKIWKQFRLEALKNSPENFGSSYEEEVNWTDLAFQDSLQKSKIFAAFDGQVLMACVGFYSLNTIKTKHCGIIWGMYTLPEYRRQGVAGALFQVVIAHAQSCVMQLHLTCVTTNISAIQFYQKFGFKIYGTEPRALKIGDAFFDEHLMMLDFTKTIYEKT